MRRFSTLLSKLDRFGCHRSILPLGGFPQSATTVNGEPRLLNSHEALISVQELMLDSTSMKQYREVTNTQTGNSVELQNAIAKVIISRGKCHNPVTNSGGVLIGTIKEMGTEFQKENKHLKIGSLIAPLGSMSTIPLHISKINDIDNDRVLVDSKNSVGVIFSSCVVCVIPDDLGLRLSLSCVDIASIIPQINRTFRNLINTHNQQKSTDKFRVLFIGCGKAGVAAMQLITDISADENLDIEIVASDYSQNSLNEVKHLNLGHKHIQIDARDPKSMIQLINNHDGFDFVINVVNVPNTETSTVLVTKQNGTIFWFSMATQFDKVALSTDALYKDIFSLVGNGYAINQVEMIFDLIRKHKGLREYFEKH